jgi:hypothetical protein
MAKEINLDDIIEKEFDDLINLNEVDTKVKIWLDSGIYALNYICSKSLYGAIPVGRVSSFKGLTGTGKSLMLASLMKDSQIDYILVIETEGGGSSKELYEFAGVDVSKVRMLKANTFGNYRVNKKNPKKIEEVADGKMPDKKDGKEWIYVEGITFMVKRFLDIINFNKIQKTILVILDSLGNTQSVRELGGTKDMGARTQDISTFFRCFDNAFEKSNIAFCFSNKLYTNIGNQYVPFVESGGVSAVYNPSISIELADTSESDDVTETEMKKERLRRKTALGSSIKTIRARVAKSRFGTELRTCRFLIDMAVGPAKYSGLFGLLKDFGVIKKASGSYYSLKELWVENFYRKNFIAKLKEDEEENIKKLQELLNRREEEILTGKQEIQVSEDVESFEEEDGELNEEDVHDLKKEMTRDLED